MITAVLSLPNTFSKSITKRMAYYELTGEEQIRSYRRRIAELVNEGEDLRVKLAELLSGKCTTSCEHISTAENSRAVTESPWLAQSILGVTNCDMNSPAASTIYLQSRSRSFSRNSIDPEVSSPLRRVLPSVGSTMHRNALITIDRNGIDSVKFRKGFTALHWAYKVGNHEAVRYLLAVGADPDALDADGKRPMDYSTKTSGAGPVRRRFDIENEYIPSRPKLSDCVDAMSLREPHRKALEAVEKYGWDSLKWGGGWTILHWAYQENRSDVIEFCRLHGVPADVRDEQGKCPADYRQPNSN